MKPGPILAIVAGALVNAGVVFVVGYALVIGSMSARLPWKPVSEPFDLRPVLEVRSAPCAAGWVVGQDGDACYQLDQATQVTAQEATATSGSTGQWVIRVTLDEASGTTFTRLTEKVHQLPEPRNQLAIVVDGKVISAPTVLEPIPGRALEITGGFDKKSAEDLARRLGG
ncbi:SecDF P1 head subdomain-containing protein [Nonomuraea sp. NPDC050790]|uniref:SecDF P1 head subdomain-containing protein n=1 Tax=Nonomuraea sp. NPDC050790 TaxID=3364371 RepID=UPI003797D60A